MERGLPENKQDVLLDAIQALTLQERDAIRELMQKEFFIEYAPTGGAILTMQ